MKSILFYTIILCLSFSQIPEKRVVAEWEPAIGTMIRWPLGIPSDLVVELASDDIVYVLVENGFQQSAATLSFNQSGVNISNVEFIYTDTCLLYTSDSADE